VWRAVKREEPIKKKIGAPGLRSFELPAQDSPFSEPKSVQRLLHLIEFRSLLAIMEVEGDMEANLIELRNYLHKELDNRLKLNPQYSKRAYSRDLGIDATSLNDFLSSIRKLLCDARF
jgi:hypothetical protein